MLKRELENPIIREVGIKITNPNRYINTTCDVCDKWEAMVQLRKTKLCEECAEEEGVKML